MILFYNLIVGYKEAAVRLSEEEERLLQDSERIVQAEVNFQAEVTFQFVS